MRAVLIALVAMATCARGQDAAALWSVLDVGETVINPVAWYRLDGDATDSSDNGYNGTWIDSEAYTNGVYSSAGWFSNSARIDTSLTNLCTSAKTNITVTFWVRAAGQRWSGFVSKYNVGTLEREWWVSVTAESPYLAVEFLAVSDPTNFNTRKTVRTGNVLSASNFIHVAAVFDSGDMSLYINGVDSTIYTSNVGFTGTALPSTRARVGIGRRTFSENYLTGSLDDVRIYDRALSAANIAAIMAGNDATEEQQ